MIDPFKIVGALGIILISIGIITKKRKIQDVFYILGGVCLEMYSLYIGDLIFIILQIIFTLAAIYDVIKIQYPKSRNRCRMGKIGQAIKNKIIL